MLFRVAYGDRPILQVGAVTLPWEIDENLMRAELSPTEHADHVTRREELWERRDSGATCTTIKGPGMPKGFAADTAEKTGVAKSTVTRALSRAKDTAALPTLRAECRFIGAFQTRRQAVPKVAV